MLRKRLPAAAGQRRPGHRRRHGHQHRPRLRAIETYLIDNPDATVDELMQIMPGPDFPTGAIIMGSAGD